MTFDNPLLIMNAMVLSFLLVATVVSRTLRLRVAGGAENAVVTNLNDRVNAWWIMALIVGSSFWLGKFAVVGLFGLASFMALREFFTLTDTRRGDHWVLLSSFFVILPLQFALVAMGKYGLFTILIPVWAFLALPVIAAVRGDTTKFFERISKVQWGLMVCVFALSHVPALLTLDIPGFEGRNVLLVAFLIFVVQMSDVLQYVWGKLLGKHKIAPSVSPSKTWEGLIGGGLSATLVGAGLFWMTPFTPFQAGAMALLITAMGFLGGLVMSAIKRDLKVKDWGDTINGHGGFVDRLDSIFFAAPVFFHVTRYFWAG